MFKLAHISDVHLSPLPDPTFNELLGKRITGYINWKKNRNAALGVETLDAIMQNLHNMAPNHLMISGDIVNLSLDKEFNQAKHWLSQQGNASDISLTFGNHDAYVRGAFAKACKIFQPWIKGDEVQTASRPFPYMRVRDQVAIIAASSAIATPPFQASGYFDQVQAQQLGKYLCEARKRNLFRVVMIHHPPFHGATHWHKKLWGIDRFQSIIKQYGAELIVHGHTHLPTLNFIEGLNAQVAVVGVASASQAFGGKKPAANYNIFNITQKQQKWSCQLERHTIINQTNEIRMTETIDLL